MFAKILQMMVSELYTVAHLKCHEFVYQSHWRFVKNDGLESLWKLLEHNKCNLVLGYKQIEGLVQERRNSIANAQELRLSYINPLKL